MALSKLSGPENQKPRVQAVGLRSLYSYFGWRPWSDFENEELSEEAIALLSGGSPEDRACWRLILRRDPSLN